MADMVPTVQRQRGSDWYVACAQSQADRLDPLTESPPSVLDEIE